MAWTNHQLLEALNHYEQECQDAGLRPNSVHSYVDYSRRFCRWRVGDYRPRNASGPTHSRSNSPATTADLIADLKAYELELRSAGLQPQAVHTYVIHADQFVRWLDGRFEPGVNLGSGRSARR